MLRPEEHLLRTHPTDNVPLATSKDSLDMLEALLGTHNNSPTIRTCSTTE